MKIIYKVKSTIKMEKVETSGYTIIDTTDNGIEDGKVTEILFESMADYIKSRTSLEESKKYS